ncbi:MAG: murein biosynthesis integral membrane protein MurJ [Proteobacteria bacterium]|nr:murein biosynthesis integral membrane protein MurJ [Pseudomonadota bacterium]NIS67526.1 murein biosynthesis integral membrane protein MurJ [Pseudomonadota bacterium]
MSEKEKIAAATGVVGTATLLSRILGYLRDMVIAYFFGAGLETDAFFVAFRIPNTLRRLFGEGSLTVSFIPVFSEYIEHRNEREWRELVNSGFTFLFLLLAIASVLGIGFAPWIARILALGWNTPGKIESLHLAVPLLRVVFPYLFFIGLVALSMGVLNALGHFAAPAIAPSLLNISMIASAFLLFRHVSPPVMALAIGVLVGGVAQLLFQIPFLMKKGIWFQPSFDFWSNPGIRRIGVLMLPGVMGTAVIQINVFVSQILATFLKTGSVSVLYYSYRLTEFPLGIFAVAVGTAALPSFSRLVTQNRPEEFREAIDFTVRLVLFLTIPAMVGLIVLRVPIIQILFQRGQFDFESTLMTAQALLFYAVGLWAMAGVRVIAPAFYAQQDMRSPVKASILALIGNAVFGIVLMGPLKHSGLALANSLAATLNFVFLILLMAKKVGSLDWWKTLRSVVKALGASMPTGLIVFRLSRLGEWGEAGSSIKDLAVLMICILAGFGTYVGVSLIVRSEEALFLISTLKRRVGGRSWK